MPDLVTTLITEEAGAPRFRREPLRRDLELLHRLLGDVLQRPAHHVVVVVGAVDGDVAAATELPRRGDHDDVRLGRIEIRGRRVAGHEQREFEEVAAVERQDLDGAEGMTASTTERVVSTAVAAAVTTTVSRTPATASSMSTTSVCPTSSTSPLRFAAAKPRAETVRSSVAGGRFATRKLPSLAVGTAREKPVAAPSR